MRVGAIMALLCVGSSGCQGLGYLASGVSGTTHIDAAYKGLAHQTVGVMVWIDRGVRIDYPDLTLDMAQAIQEKITQADKAKTKEVEGVQWVNADSLARYQDDHPEIEGEPVTDYAPKLPLTRLIYVEVSKFELRPVDPVELYRGDAICSVRVVEIHNGVATIGYEDDKVETIHPQNSPAEGQPIPDGGYDKFYQDTVDDFTTSIVEKFIPYDVQTDDEAN